jgi:hypothetical protein
LIYKPFWMKNIAYLFVLLVGLLVNSSCKKDSKNTGESPTHLPPNHSLEKGLVSFSVNGEFVPSVIDTLTNTITVTLPDGADIHNLTATFLLASNVNVTVNNAPVAGSTVIDLGTQSVITVTSTDNVRHTSFTIVPQTELQYFGVGGIMQGATSLSRSYSFYYDQFDGSTWQAINCGPTVTTMAIKWADSNFTKNPVDARNEILPSGGWWYTNHVQIYLTEHGINNTVDTLSDVAALVKQAVDNGDALILCLDMFSVPYNGLDYQHTQKFYPTGAAGWGHFLFVKGYKQTSTNFYLEIYDPYSGGDRYNSIGGNQLKGRDRYYASDGIKAATNIWWPYAIILAPRGKSIRFSTHLKVDGLRKTIPVAGGQ